MWNCEKCQKEYKPEQIISPKGAAANLNPNLNTDAILAAIRDVKDDVKDGNGRLETKIDNIH